jgi:hypothetical protein
MQLNRFQAEYFTSLFGYDPAYWDGKPGRAGFFPAQLKLKHEVSWLESCRLSYAFNRWLDTLETLVVPYNWSPRLKTCTWNFAKKREGIVQNKRCRLPICPWCQGYVMLKALGALKKSKSNVFVHRQGYLDESKKVFTAPRWRDIKFSIRYIQIVPDVAGPTFMAEAVHFTYNEKKLENVLSEGQSLIYNTLWPKIDLYSAVDMNVYCEKLKRLRKLSFSQRP